MAVGRQAAHSRERPDVTVPLLFMRSDTGRLFAEDPVLQIQQAMARADDLVLFADADYIPLPIDVIAVREQQSIAGLHETGGLQTSARDFSQVLEHHLTRPSRARPRIHFLVGSYGTNRTTQLRRVVWDTLQRRSARRLPVYVDLRGFPGARRGAREPIRKPIYDALRSHWPELTWETLGDLLHDGPRLHLLFDRGESLPEAERRRAWESIARFSADAAHKHWRHDYVITAEPPSEMDLPSAFSGKKPGVEVIRLYIQPLALRKVRRFLHHWSQEKSLPALYEYLVRARLTDLVTLPFMMVRFLVRAAVDDLAPSRAALLQDLLDDGLARLEDRPSMATHAMPFLTALAREMQQAGVAAWPLDDALGLLARIRGEREYSMTKFLEALIAAEILARVGPDRLGFAYAAVQAYCCALAIAEQADWEATVDEIVITLSNEERQRRWSETLIFLASILGDRPPDFSRLLYKLVYGVDLFQSDLVFLTARCLMQGRRLLGQEESAAADNTFAGDLERQVVDALAMRLDPQVESRPARQEQAVELLGQLAYLTPRRSVPILVQTANRRVRLSAGGADDFHFSNVRFAALTVLEELWQSVEARARHNSGHSSLAAALDTLETELGIHLATGDPELLDVLEVWNAPDGGAALRAQFLALVAQGAPDEAERDVAGLAALALGDLTNRQWADAARETREAEAIVQFLGEQLLSLSPAEWDHTLWAVTHALAMGPVPLVRAQVIEPFVRQESAAGRQRRPARAAASQVHGLPGGAAAAAQRSRLRLPARALSAPLQRHAPLGGGDRRPGLDRRPGPGAASAAAAGPGLKPLRDPLSRDALLPAGNPLRATAGAGRPGRHRRAGGAGAAARRGEDAAGASSGPPPRPAADHIAPGGGAAGGGTVGPGVRCRLSKERRELTTNRIRQHNLAALFERFMVSGFGHFQKLASIFSAWSAT